jgi:NAD(P)H-hydrate epimerase
MKRLTRAQVREVDRLAVERYHLPSIVLMENAARSVTDAALEMLRLAGGRVVIACGGGNNGGDGLAIARHLHNRRHRVEINLFTSVTEFEGDALTNWQVTRMMGLPAEPFSPQSLVAEPPALVIDAVFGTGLSQPPRGGLLTSFVQALGRSGVPVLSVDVPSGLDCDTGQPLGPCVRATRTVTFVAEKVGFAAAAAGEFLGDVTIGDIGVPRELIEEIAGAET